MYFQCVCLFFILDPVSTLRIEIVGRLNLNIFVTKLKMFFGS